jgi:hypothetical protein
VGEGGVEHQLGTCPEKRPADGRHDDPFGGGIRLLRVAPRSGEWVASSAPNRTVTGTSMYSAASVGLPSAAAWSGLVWRCQ